VIESYSFGRIKIDGRFYTSDVVIFPDHVNDRWWRKEGHRLSVEDLAEVWQAEPEILVVGTGYYGLMKMPNEVREYIAAKSIELTVENTKQACQTYNQLEPAKKVVAAFHLTC
jgi:hypothetical protein